MIYTIEKLKKMELDDSKIVDIVKAGVIDKSEVIKNCLIEILNETGDDYQSHFDNFLFDLEKIILENGSIYGEYSKDLFDKVLKIKLVKSSTFANENNYMFLNKETKENFNYYSNFIKLIANEKYYSNITYNKTCLSSLYKSFDLSIEVMKEEYDDNFEEGYVIQNIYLGDIENFNQSNNELLLVLNEERNSSGTSNDIYRLCKYTLYIVI